MLRKKINLNGYGRTRKYFESHGLDNRKLSGKNNALTAISDLASKRLEMIGFLHR